ncbi:AI-2E family transporter [Pontiella agarivorans]|uniref:AI-2E family transporter n=1 Tax=Pontiella agarivorans TaxID=3038953 RepID=A0ABU5MVP7_9BACT|nr:AI-2E family transporter [Pontiella agarivorans]MDZ8118270.1 AI-2E family transporter [Pontiella agarivorans]
MGTGEYIKRVTVTLLLAVLLFTLWSTRNILVLAFASVVIAIAMAQPMQLLQKKGIKRGLALTLSVAFSFTAITLLSLWIIPTLGKGVADIVQDLPAAAESAKTAYENFWTNTPAVQTFLPEIPAADTHAPIDADSIHEMFNWLVKSGMAIAPDLLGGIGIVAGILVNLGLVLFIAVFFLLEPQSYIKALLYLIPARQHPRAKDIIRILGTTLTKWLNAQLFSVTVIVLLVYIILGLILRMPNAMVVALFAGFATFIPNIGAVLPILPITIFTLAYSDPAKLLLYIPVYLAIQFTESNIITPQVVKAQLNIPAGYLMIFQLLITMALGALGLVLAVPILACLIVFVREIYAYDILKLRNVNVHLDDR